MKKAVFLGASNTYGVGLWFFRDCYKDLNNVITTWPYPAQSLDDSKFVKNNRYSSLVSTHLNLTEINVGEAGGSPAQSLHLLNKMNLDEIEYVVFEFSCLTSFFDRYFYESVDTSNPNNTVHIPKTPGEIESFLTNGKNDRPELRERIYDWLDTFNPDEFTDEVLDTIKEFIDTNKKIKFIILIWRNHNPTHFKFDSDKFKWILNHSPKFPIKSNENNILVEDYLTENKIRVCDEFVHINEMKFPAGHTDLHPSLNGHKHIFEILKNYIDEKNTTNSW